MTDGLWVDGQTDGDDCNIPDAFLKKRGDKNKSGYKKVPQCLSTQ